MLMRAAFRPDNNYYEAEGFINRLLGVL